MISSELPEVLGIADRVLVMHEGRLVEELSPRRGQRGARDPRRHRPDPGGRMSTSHRTRRGRPRAPSDRVGLPRPRAGHRRRARAADRGHRDHRAALHRGGLAPQPRAERVDLRDPRRGPDARAHDPQRRPLGRLGARALGAYLAGDLLSAHPGMPLPARVRPRHGARRRLRAAQRRARHLGPGARARRDARDALRLPRPGVPVDGRPPGQRRDAAGLVPQPRLATRSPASRSS